MEGKACIFVSGKLCLGQVLWLAPGKDGFAVSLPCMDGQRRGMILFAGFPFRQTVLSFPCRLQPAADGAEVRPGGSHRFQGY